MTNRWMKSGWTLDEKDSDRLYFLCSIITVNGDCSHEIRRRLLLGRKASTNLVQFRSIQFSCSVMSDSVTPWTAAHQASLSITNSQSPPKPMSIESVMPSNHLILCCPLLLLPLIFPSIRVFSNESDLDSVLKSRDTISPTKVHIIKAMIFTVVSMDMRAGP